MTPKIVDCSIRDGGHLNKWHFSPQCVKASYFAALKAGVDYFEIGYRAPETVSGLGDFGYCRDEFLFSLFKASDKCKLTVMIDAGKEESSFFKTCTSENTPVRAVRVAAYPYELAKAVQQLEDLHEKGYEVFFNLMAYSELTDERMDFLQKWNSKHILQAVIFADSFGAFIPTDIPKHVKRLRDAGFERIGFHSHNNLQMAFANTLKAIEEGVTVIDASIYGMGRGSGNLPVEVFVGYMEKMGNKAYNAVPYIDVIERYFLDMFKDLNWGYKIQSLMGGIKNVHPYYVDDLFKRKNYTVGEIWNALDLIKEKCPISFSVEKLNEMLENRFYTPLERDRAAEICQSISDHVKIIPAQDAFISGHFSLSGKHHGKKVLVIANGPSIVIGKEQIKAFIQNEQCITIGTNFLQGNFIPDYHIFVSRKRFLKYASSVSKQSTLLVPSFFGKEIVQENFTGNTVFFELQTVTDLNMQAIDGSSQKVVNLNVAISAILAAFQMGAAEIFAVGMDGYIDELNRKMVFFYNEDDVPDDKEVASYRYEMLASELDRVNRFLQDNSVPFSIITPTSHRKYYRKAL